jgi:hypothetical protein
MATRDDPDTGQLLDLARAGDRAALGQLQVRHFLQEALRHGADDSKGQNTLAWFLATCPDPQFRDGSQAVDLAWKAATRTPNDGAISLQAPRPHRFLKVLLRLL